MCFRGTWCLERCLREAFEVPERCLRDLIGALEVP